MDLSALKKQTPAILSKRREKVSNFFTVEQLDLQPWWLAGQNKQTVQDTWTPGGWPARSLEQAYFLLFILNLVIWVGWMTVWDKQTCFCFFCIWLFVSCDCLCEL